MFISSQALLRFEYRVPRLLIAGFSSLVEIHLTSETPEPLRGVRIELLSNAFANGGAELYLEEFHDTSQVFYLPVKPEVAGVFVVEGRITAGTERGQLSARGRPDAHLTVLHPPDSIQNISIIVQEKAFFGAITQDINFGQFRSLNDLLAHSFDEAPWHPVPLVWTGFPVVRGLKEGFIFANRFRLVRTLGQGGMGVVWLAEDSALKDRSVALKFLPEEVCHDPGAIDDLRDEVLKARDLAHDNIVRIYDLHEQDGTAAISMEYIDGPTLDAYRRTLPDKVLEVADAMAILQPLCSALDYAHARGLIHHDLKPLNLMLTSTGVLKVCDFGLAGSLCETRSKLSGRHHTTSGTTPYMSPQQLLMGTRTAADDIYSLGATLYELMTGKPPFYRGELLRQIESEVPPTITDRRRSLGKSGQSIPPAWEQLIAACLAKAVPERPAKAGMVYTLGMATQTKPEKPSQAKPLQAPPPVPQPTPTHPQPTKHTRARIWLLIGALGIAWVACLIKLNTHYLESTRTNAAKLREPTVLKSNNPVIQRMTTQGNSLGMKFVPFSEQAGAKVLGCIHETRSKDYAAFMAEGSYKMEGADADDWRIGECEGYPVGRGKGERAEDSNHPARYVSYDNAKAFTAWLTKRERASGLIGPKDEYRLPTDQEWSLMVGLAKETGTTPRERSLNGPEDISPWGRGSQPPSDNLGNYADEISKPLTTGFMRGYIHNYTDGYATTAPVMSFPSNPLGFYDLGGNVWEWCDDWFGGSNGDKYDRVLRGASWYNSGAPLLLSSYRSSREPDTHIGLIGFRCVLVVSGG